MMPGILPFGLLLIFDLLLAGPLWEPPEPALVCREKTCFELVALAGKTSSIPLLGEVTVGAEARETGAVFA